MTWWPGWDSIANTGWWSHFWFWFGIACLFALGASEVVSHVYGLRKDELVTAAERAATEQRERDADAAEARRKAEVEAVQQKLSEADKKVSDLQKSTTHRRLTADQKQALKTALEPFAGRKVSVTTVMGSDDGLAFADDFVEVFRAARWNVDGSSPSQSVFTITQIGLEPTMNDRRLRQIECRQVWLRSWKRSQASD
jgi:hypothetical protein